MLLKEVARRGLSPEDVEDLEFDTPAELRLALDVIEQKKQMKQLQQSITASQEKKSSESPVDTGGPTGGREADQVQRSEKLQQSYAKAREAGRTAEGRWQLLQAIHKDPSKVIRTTPANEDE
jgi:transcriptional regulator of acetoin/glycerol metabolism